MGPGESIITGTPATRRMLETSAIRPSMHFKTLVGGVEERIARGATFKPGEILGWTPEGKGIAYREGMDLLGVETFETAGKGQFKSISYIETHRPGIARKVFGASAGFKAMEKFVDPLAMENAVVAMTEGMSPEARKQFFNFGGAWRIVAGDELRKDASKRNTQIITGLWDMIDRTRTRDVIARDRRLSFFMHKPKEFAGYVFRKYGGGEGFVRGMEKTARQFGLTPGQMGAVFGTEGISLGVSQAMFEKELGAGGLGSVEPRIYDLLRGGQYGPLGGEIAEDLVLRSAATDPRKVAAYDALTRTLQSVKGLVSPGKGARIWELTGKEARGYGATAFQSWIEEGGGWLRAGKRDIFVPGGDILKPYMTAAGGVVRGDVANIYHTFARELSATKSADLLDADAALRNFIGGITEQQAPFGKGAGALLGKKRKIAGSRFLTGLTKVRDFAAQTPWEVGIPEGMVGKTSVYKSLFFSTS
jgi:hypothetical protein